MIVYISADVKKEIEFRTEKNYNGAVNKKVIVFFIFLALAIRLFPGPDKFIFTYDQARDAFISRQIIENRDLKIIGPPAAVSLEITGAFHGPLYYYLISPFYVFSRGNPNAVLFLTILINSLTLIPLAFLVQKLFSNKWVTILSLTLFIFSFEQHSYARWLSNPGPAVFFLVLFQLGLWLILENHKNSWGWFLTPLGLSLAIQHQFFLLFALPISIFIILLFGKFPKNLKPYLISTTTLLVGLATFIVAELKFKFPTTKGLFLSLIADFISSPKSTTQFLSYFLNRFSETLMNNTLNLNQAAAFCFFLFALAVIFHYWKNFSKTEKTAVLFLLLLILSQTILFLFSELKAYFITLGMAVPIVVLISFSMILLFKSQKLITLVLIIFMLLSNLFKIINLNQQTTPIFAVQKMMTLASEKKVIDSCYRLVKNQPFSLNTVTNPLFINTTWAYLFQSIALAKYGYLPSWSGIPQKDYLGEKVLPVEEEKTDLRILIIEPKNGLPEIWIEASVEEENFQTRLIEEEKVGNFTVQLRQKLTAEESKKKQNEIISLRKKPSDSLSVVERSMLHIYNLRRQTK